MPARTGNDAVTGHEEGRNAGPREAGPARRRVSGVGTTGGDGSGPREWRLGGRWLAWFWMSWTICAAVFLGGLAVVALGGPAPGGGVPVTLGVAVVLFAVAGLTGWQLLSTALVVVLHADGTVTMRRQRGAVRTHVARIRRVRPSALRSGYTPTVVETVDGWAYLVNTRSEREHMVATLRQLNPDIVIGTHGTGSARPAR